MNVIITGGTKGIGRAIADLLWKEGFNLAICARNQTDLDNMHNDFKDSEDQKLLTQSCDVSVKEDVLQFAEYVLSEWNKIDVLINNAGVFFPGVLIEEEDGTLEKMIDTNLYSAYHLTRKIAPIMIENGQGHIINMCSIASQIAYPNGGSYSISKFAMLGFSKVLREELKDKGVRVTSILPGATWSNSWAGADLPAERLMEANDIAIAVQAAIKMSHAAVMEEIIVRPQLGDL